MMDLACRVDSVALARATGQVSCLAESSLSMQYRCHVSQVTCLVVMQSEGSEHETSGNNNSHDAEALRHYGLPTQFGGLKSNNVNTFNETHALMVSEI